MKGGRRGTSSGRRGDRFFRAETDLRGGRRDGRSFPPSYPTTIASVGFFFRFFSEDVSPVFPYVFIRVEEVLG